MLFAATIFLSAFLLFQVQPMVGKYILPWFGSTPGVWTTALLFFQLMLLAGYAYAHFVVSRLTWRRQAVVHAALLALALVALPITPWEVLKPTDSDAPIGRILLILTLSVGAPFFLLSATAPLIQRWFAQLHPGRSPYRLYALSNLASLLALLSYPFLIEPRLRLQAQTSIWSSGYVVFAGLCATCGWHLARGLGSAASEQAEVVEPVRDPEDRPGASLAVLWLSLSTCGSGLLMATTNQMSLDIAAVPFLWIVPLSLYLLTFILCFDSERWYVRPLFAALLPPALIGVLHLLYSGVDVGIVDQVVGYSAALFVFCMCCHGELARLRPAPRHLTFFFLMVSAGGAVGGLFVAVVAPAVFPGFYEYPILLVALFALVVFVQVPGFFRDSDDAPKSLLVRGLSGICWAAALVTIGVGSYYAIRPSSWYGDDASFHLVATFAEWRTGMLTMLPYVGGTVLALVEGWRRTQRASLRDWWWSRRGPARLAVSAVLALGLWSLTGSFIWQIRESDRRVVEQGRNFYAMLSITERDAEDEDHRLSLTHGRIRHGHQLQEYPTWPTTYYGPRTGIGLAVRHHPARSDDAHEFRVGIIGLGVGTMATYANHFVDPDRSRQNYVLAREGGVPDYLRFYEINPLVVKWANERFTFLADATARGADVDVFEGDARIVLERQIERGELQRFDVLAVDAFSSDAIPIHLLTRESFQTYLAHLQEDGILAIHVTNRHVDLAPIVGRLAEATGLTAIYIENSSRDSRFVSSTDWILLTSNQAFLATDAVREDEEHMPEPGSLWTDDFSSVFEVVEFGN